MSIVPAFGELHASQVLGEDPLFVLVWDRYPVSPGHCLVIPKRPVARFGDLLPDEKVGLIHWIDRAMRRVQQALSPSPQGFNVGFNDGPAAGQTIAQFHAHIIPRYAGDVADPRGGIRWVIPDKAPYWD